MNLEKTGEKFDTLAFIMAYEGGEIDNEDEVLEGFQHLVDSGLAWQLQGSYGRAAAAMIEAGMIRDPRELRSSMILEGAVCPIPPDGDEIARLATALSKLPKTITEPGTYAAKGNGTDGRVYGGDPNLVHIADGTRADVGAAMATALESLMRSEAIANGSRTEQDAMNQALCPGCYMVAVFNMAVALAKANGQSLTELGASMAGAFSRLATGGEDRIESIVVALDSDDSAYLAGFTPEPRRPTPEEWEAAKHSEGALAHLEHVEAAFSFPYMESM